ncbi:MAG: SlyX family protein [Xanthomonadales bacterium]|jgi:SlyX protein|nr:SlyX family protein [Xanthomonadales bacterium]
MDWVRIEELESRLAFQDDLIESLNEVVARQDRELLRLAQRVAALEERLNDLASAAGGGGESQGHEVPPHY